MQTTMVERQGNVCLLSKTCSIQKRNQRMYARDAMHSQPRIIRGNTPLSDIWNLPCIWSVRKELLRRLWEQAHEKCVDEFAAGLSGAWLDHVRGASDRAADSSWQN